MRLAKTVQNWSSRDCPRSRTEIRQAKTVQNRSCGRPGPGQSSVVGIWESTVVVCFGNVGIEKKKGAAYESQRPRRLTTTSAKKSVLEDLARVTSYSRRKIYFCKKICAGRPRPGHVVQSSKNQRPRKIRGWRLLLRIGQNWPRPRTDPRIEKKIQAQTIKLRQAKTVWNSFDPSE